MRLRITEAIERLLKDVSESTKAEMLIEVGDLWIDHKSAIKLGKYFHIPLAILLKGTEVYVEPAPPPPPKSSEYLELISRLRREEDERHYRAMIEDSSKSVDPSSNNIRSVTKQVNEQLTTIFNILVSIVAVAWAFWYWCSSWSLGARTLTSLFAGILTGVAEIVVYTGYLRRVEEAKTRCKNNTDSRQIIREIVFHNGKEFLKSDIQQDDAAVVVEHQKAHTTTASSEKRNIVHHRRRKNS